MSKFINTQYKNTIDSLVEGLKKRLDNPYYLFTDKKASIVDYYNTNVEKTTLDESIKIPYSPLGKNSPKRFNLIKDAYLFGIERIMINLENGEYGLESNPIEGDAVVLPNTFIPYPDDYFSITYLNKKLLFRILEVSFDTLENGSNLYKINYRLDQTEEDVIYKQIIEEYRMIVNNVGTKYNTVIKSTNYELIEHLEIILSSLKKYYKNLFFDKKVQTFIFSMNNSLLYDPFLIEFIIRNNILAGDEYLYISHQTFVPVTFAIDYDKTFFKSIELGDKNKITSRLSSISEMITDSNSLLSTRIEYYYKIIYTDTPEYLNTKIDNFDLDMIEKIKNNEYYELNDKKRMYNIIISYFNNGKIDKEIIEILESIDYNSNITIFYSIPIIIYIIEYYIKNLLK